MYYFCQRLLTLNNYFNMEAIKRKGNKIEIDRNDLAFELKLYRCKNGLSQEELAKSWGVSRWSIMRTEAAKEVSTGLSLLIYSRLSEELRKELEIVKIQRTTISQK